jgi:hypothetical protein
LLIDALTLGPVSGPEDADYAVAVREPDGHDPASVRSEAEVPRLFDGTVLKVFSQDTTLVEKGPLGLREADAVFGLIEAVFRRVPLE